ncbi:hypothetical protein EDD16DRAFT_396280 [Pisolithus croceorrhizus]|nr:hypothetical protein EDD16DRAFT_396280 [Pisolithus croceorrhizus]
MYTLNICCEHFFSCQITFLLYGSLNPSSREATGRENSIVYDRHLDTPSVVQQIEALQVKLDTTEDEDEQRALEEDVTGKILWLCWCGICAEVDELLPKVGQLFRLHRFLVTWFRLWITSERRDREVSGITCLGMIIIPSVGFVVHVRDYDCGAYDACS